MKIEPPVEIDLGPATEPEQIQLVLSEARTGATLMVHNGIHS